jgi:hypothetical protein
VTCQNCGADNARARSYDMDLPTVYLCDMCALLLVIDQDMFDQMARPKRPKRRRAYSSAPRIAR